MLIYRRFIITLLIVSTACFPLLAQTVDPNVNVDRNGVAMGGYDAVEYLKSNRAVEGNKDFTLTWKGAIYRFRSRENLEIFRKDPEAYLPAYGGWCAYAMGDSGDKVRVDPETFKIIDGKTYLFYNFFFNNTLNSWNKDEQNLKRQADRNWQKIINKK